MRERWRNEEGVEEGREEEGEGGKEGEGETFMKRFPWYIKFKKKTTKVQENVHSIQPLYTKGEHTCNSIKIIWKDNQKLTTDPLVGG